MSDTQDPEFDRPVFIVSSPRSGAELLFETLMRAPRVFTVGSASHKLVEGIDALHVRAHSFDSNRLGTADATPEVIAQVRQGYRDGAVDRDGANPRRLPLRLLDKTPKHSLRIPFLTEVFPQAHFIYLYRDPREALTNMLLAWESNRYCTYKTLPGWPRPHWSLLLTPGWRELAGKPLADIVAGQWRAATEVLLDDLAALDAGRWRVVRYQDFIENPAGEIARLCLSLDYAWDRPLDGGLAGLIKPPTVADAEIVRRHAADLQRVWPSVQATAERAARVAGVTRVH